MFAKCATVLGRDGPGLRKWGMGAMLQGLLTVGSVVLAALRVVQFWD